MGVAGHEDVFILLALGDKFVEETLYLVGDVLELMTGEEFEIYQHLVVAGTSAVDLLTHVAQFAGEQHLYLRVHILHIVLDDKLALLARMIDILQFGKELCEFVFLKESDGFKHGNMCHRTEDIVFC